MLRRSRVVTVNFSSGKDSHATLRASFAVAAGLLGSWRCRFGRPRTPSALEIGPYRTFEAVLQLGEEGKSQSRRPGACERTIWSYLSATDHEPNTWARCSWGLRRRHWRCQVALAFGVTAALDVVLVSVIFLG